jgi:transglutaminase-like putative cysteine protease
MVLGLLIHLQSVTGITVNFWTKLLLALMVVVVLSFFERYPASLIAGKAGGVTLVLMFLTSASSLHVLQPGFTVLSAVQYLERLMLGNRALADWMNGLYYYALDYERYPFQGVNLFYIFFTLIFLTLAWMAFNTRRRLRGLLILPMLVMVLSWFQGYNVTPGFLVYFTGYIGYRFTSEGERGYTGVVIAGLVLMIGVGIYTVFPVDRSIEFLDKKFGEVSFLRSEYSRFSGGGFSFDDTIYEPLDNRLGGPVSLRRDKVFKVRSTHGGQIYLRGRVLTEYDGQKWSSTEAPFDNFYLDLAPTYGAESIEYDLEIFDFDLKTKTVFAPLGIKGIDIPPQILKRDPYGIIYLDRPVSDLSGGYRLSTLEHLPFRLNSGNEYYQLPDKYSPKVIELVQQLTNTRSAQGDIYAIRDYLLEIPYSLSPGIPLQGADFVEQFLFEEKKGYCTYFASAMVVMSRAAGIPARYVEGYLTPYRSNQDGDYIVSADRAHAWAEVYQNGVWMVIEATPVYVAETIETNGGTTTGESGEVAPEIPREQEGDIEVDIPVGEGTGTIGGTKVLIFGLSAGLVALLLAAGGIFIRLRDKRRYGTLENVRLADEIMTRLILRHGLTKWSFMTPRELIHYSAQADYNLDERKLTACVESAYYGTLRETETLLELAAFRDRLISSETSVIRKTKYWIWIHLKGERSTWT